MEKLCIKLSLSTSIKTQKLFTVEEETSYEQPGLQNVNNVFNNVVKK